MFSAITTGTPSEKTRSAMKRSPAPIRSRADEDEQDRVDVLERPVDGALHALGHRVERALEARQVDEHELVAVAVHDAEIRRRVVCGLSETIATLPPTSAFTSVDLPTFGRPATATNPDFTARTSRAAARPACA